MRKIGTTDTSVADGVEKIYDLANCGPRHRFCTPFAVAHNCLGLGYGCGSNKFAVVAKMMANLELTPEVCAATVNDFRARNPGIVKLWREHQYILSLSADRHDPVHEIELPSGRILSYFNPVRVGPAVPGGMGGFKASFVRGETPRHLYGGLLCIAEGTPVLTGRGWIAIEEVVHTDLVWDGDAWVFQDGSVCNGVAEVIEAFGARVTADHLVMTAHGWERASVGRSFEKAECRIPDQFATPLEINWDRTAVRVGPGNTARVYDLVNCGPRHRFVIATPTGPLIVHNCENEIQAIARDLLRDAWIALHESGFRVLFTVHDEFVIELPKSGAERLAEEAKQVILSASPWAKGCPLDASCVLSDVYVK